MDMIVKSESLTSVADAIREKGETTEQLIFPSDFVTAIHAIKGGGDLNFEIVGNPKPENPNPNTIWLDTDDEITGWIFSAEEPETPGVGMIWFTTGVSVGIEINALKENGIMIYPINARQYDGIAWADVSAMSYNGNEWVSWTVYLFDYGKQTYQWQPRGWKHSVSTHNAQVPSVVNNSDGSITFSLTSSASNYLGGGGMELVNDFDITGVKTLELECDYSTTATKGVPGLRLLVIPRNATYWGTEAVCQVATFSEGEQTLKLDIPETVTGTYDIAVIIWLNTGSDGAGTTSCTMKTLKALR